MAYNSNIEILRRFQDRCLRIIVNGTAPVILYIMILMYHILETKIKDSAKPKKDDKRGKIDTLGSHYWRPIILHTLKKSFTVKEYANKIEKIPIYSRLTS